MISPLSAETFVSHLFGLEMAIAKFLTAFISLFELTLGTFLLIGGKWIAFSAFLSCALSLALTLIVLLNLNYSSSCGCFGDLLPTDSGIQLLFRNLGVLFLSFVLLRLCSGNYNQQYERQNDEA